MQLDLEAKQQFQQRFKILSLLGKGSFGFVYECEDKCDGQIYAVKVISKNNVKRSKIQCLREEAKILSTIVHPNIVKVYEFVQTDTFIYLKMEIMKNGTLQKMIKQRWENGKKFNDDEIATIMGAIFKGVNHIHSVSIIHRDIKPQNILLANEGNLQDLKIADFGLSTKLDFYYPKTATSKCGTMLYMAPQILCNYTYTKSIDIWSCSIIMYMLYVGKHPFYQSKMSTEDYKRKIKTVKFGCLPNKLAQDFINKISKVETNQRYTTQQCLKHPWLTRNFDDQIPLSLHESFSGFQKSHEISHVIKLFLGIKQTVKLSQQIKVPQNYLNKKQYYIRQNRSQNSKSKSKQSTRQINSLSDMNKSLQKSKQKFQGKNYMKNSQVDNQNPTIMKLNSIFNSLFGKRSKLNQKTDDANHPVKQNTTDIPDISSFKEKIEGQIERAVFQFKNNSKCTHKRILPCRSARYIESDQYIGLNYKDQNKIQEKTTNNRYKIRPRKRVSCGIKLYQ